MNDTHPAMLVNSADDSARQCDRLMNLDKTELRALKNPERRWAKASGSQGPSL
jgi:hypothetical protein